MTATVNRRSRTYKGRMAKRFGWALPGIFNNDPPKSPWGGGGKGDGDGGSGSGPRNPWSFPPAGKRPAPGGGGGGGGPLDELLRRARRGGPGFPGLPDGVNLWLLAIGLLVALWLVFTCFHLIRPAERGVVLVLGRYSQTLEPGVGITFPAPFVTVQTIDVQNYHTETFPENGNENLMLTSDRNIVDVSYQVQWDISSASDFAFQIKEPQETVKATAETAMRSVIATTTLNDVIGTGGANIQALVQNEMQAILDSYHSGIRVRSVAINKAIYPQAVDEAFKQVTVAQQGAESAKNAARGYAQQVIATAQGETGAFDRIYAQYKLAPEVTRRRLYYETMEQVLSKSNKVIVESPGVTPYLPLPALARPAPDAAKPGAGQ